MDAKFYIKSLSSSSSINGGGDTEKELDDVEKELDKLADKLLKEGFTLFDKNPHVEIIPKSSFDPDIDITVRIIKEDQNSQYAIVPESESSNSLDVIFVNEEHFNYFNNKFIKYSAKDFIIKSLIHYISHSINLLSLVNVDDYENDEEIIQAIIDILALDGFKFPLNSMVLNDIDIICLNNNPTLLFDKNETKKIFNVYLSKDSDRHLIFKVEGIGSYGSKIIFGPDKNEYKTIMQQSL